MAIFPRYKEIIDLIKKGATVEAQEKIMEPREAALELQEKNIELKERIGRLEEELEVKNKLVWERPYYWMEHEGEKIGPFCQNCYDADKKLVRLQKGNSKGYWNCYSCDRGYRERGEPKSGVKAYTL